MIKMNKWIELKENKNYEINENGFIRRKGTKKILRGGKSTNGYYTVSLCENGKQKSYYIHRLIANNFLKNKNNYKEINHKDGNKYNNCIDNLEWCSRSDNIKHAYKNELIPKKYGIDNKLSKKIKQTNLITGNVILWNSMMDAKRKMGYSTGSICMACKGELKTAYKSKWEYV